MSVDAATIAGAGRNSRPAEVKVWDPLVRLFHWGLVGAFALAWATGDELDRVHEIAGYAIIGLVAFRLAWGIIGSRHARFADFVRGPGTVTAYLRDSLSFRARRYLGHNPAGGAMIILLLVMLAATCGTGVMMTTDEFWGVEWVEDVHVLSVNVTLGLVALHLLGVLFASIEHGENLVRAMVTGRKRAIAGDA